jgi:hypothetical protein
MSGLRIAFAFALFAGSLAAAGGAADKQTQIQGAYDRQCKAAVAKNMSAFASTFSKSYVAIDLDRNSQTLDQVIAAVETPPQGMTFDACTFLIREFSSDGDTATVAETQTVAGSVLQDGASKPFIHVEDSVDTWKISGTPLELTSTGTGERMTIDGLAVLDRGILASPQP